MKMPKFKLGELVYWGTSPTDYDVGIKSGLITALYLFGNTYWYMVADWPIPTKHREDHLTNDFDIIFKQCCQSSGVWREPEESKKVLEISMACYEERHTDCPRRPGDCDCICHLEKKEAAK